VETQTDQGAHAAALALVEAFGALGIEVTSARAAYGPPAPVPGPQAVEGVRVGLMGTESVWALCGILTAEASRLSAAASLRSALSEVGARQGQ
jgi:hypothetical protein